MSAPSSVKLLIVDDEAAQMTALCNTLGQQGYSPTGFTSANQALEALRQQEFDLVLTDLMMPEMDGIALLRAVLEIDATLVGIVMTGHGTIDTAVEAMKTGALDYILKPFSLSAILPVLARAVAVRRLRMENIQLREAVKIYELSMGISFALDFNGVLEHVADTAFQQTQASEMAILLMARDGKELHVAAARGQNAEQTRGKRVPITDAISRWLMESRALLSKPEDLTDLQSALVCPLRDIGNGISIPMLTAGRLVGILHFTPARSHRAITLGQVKALKIQAGTAASALEAAVLLEQLRAAEQRYRRLAENAPDLVFRYELRPHQRFAYVNPVVTMITGYSPEEHYADPDLGFKIVHPEDRPLLEEILRGDSPTGSTATLRWIHRNGGLIWIEQRNVFVRDEAGQLVAIEGIARDITERKQLEEQLRQAQKMEAIGHLAGGVAHDFNNLLTAINGYSELMLIETSLEPAMRQTIEQVKNAGEQAAVLTRQLLAFGRKQLLQPRVLDLNAVVETNSKLLRRVIGEHIEFVTVLDPALRSVKADPGQLGQILMNLVVNSRDAMPRGGKLTVETRNVMLDETYAHDHISVHAGPYAMLAVSDTGCGMDPSTRSRIFEPFFTTKESGRGTGLGLSIVYGIVKQSGGNIWVYSEPDKGTTFKIYLPCTDELEARGEPPAVRGGVTGGSESILVVEDDAVVRQLTYRILQKVGYKVLEAQHGSEALKICQEHEGQIRLVLTDLVMPEMSGVALAEALRKLNPEIKVLYTSGYADDAIVRHGHLDPGMPFIQKPFGPHDLLRKVREVLGEEATRSV